MSWFLGLRGVLSILVSVCLVLAMIRRDLELSRPAFWFFMLASACGISGLLLSERLEERLLLAPWAWALAFAAGTLAEKRRRSQGEAREAEKAGAPSRPVLLAGGSEDRSSPAEVVEHGRVFQSRERAGR